MAPERRVALQPGYLLHHRPYRNSSALLEVFSRDYGRIALVGRGVRGPRSRLRGVLQPFVPLLLSWSGGGELHTLTGAELAAPLRPLSGERLLSGFYLNELLLRLTQRADPHPQLFEHYRRMLGRLAEADAAESWLRVFERDLLGELGYGLILEYDAETGAPISGEAAYCYQIERGPVRCAHADTPGVRLQGATLLALAAGELHSPQALQEAKTLMRVVLAHYLGGPLKTRDAYWRRL